MRALAVIGAQLGDEAKGKVVHFLAKDADLCVRFNGGPNAGHTVVDRFGTARLHQVPAGALHPRCLGVLAHGMVLDLWALRSELEELSSQGRPRPKLLISQRAHLILPAHKAREEEEGTAARIGTTRRGIGPAYADRARRLGIRLLDLGKQKVIWEKLPKLSGGARDIEALVGELRELWQEFQGMVGDDRACIAQALEEGKAVVFEGAQGTLLDLDLGTYPYVTSSATTVHGVGWGTGVRVDFSEVIGVAKAYVTRVGEGPFPTEESGDVGEALRRQGEEYGATTGRPRRCGWLDLVALRYAHEVNRFTSLALTKLDVLSGLPQVKVAVAYRTSGALRRDFPAAAEELFSATPVYETLPGWTEETRGLTSFADLPPAAQDYVRFVEESLGVPVALVGTGPGENDLIVRRPLDWES